jgi:predicted dehydrogenase
MSNRVRVGIVGTSGYPQFVYLPVLTKHENVEVVAICGRNRTRAEEVAAKWGISHVYTDYREMFGQPNLDAVIIASPDDLHYPMTMAALQAGLHVLCEKPMALNAQQAQEMLEAADRAGVKHMIMFTWRWFPQYQFMQKLLADGFVGRSYHAHIRFLSNQARTNEYRWLFDPQHSIGALGAIGSHMIDMARFLFGDMTRVSAHLGTYMERIGLDEKPYLGANESALLALEYANGTQGMIHVSQVAHTADRWREQYISVHGDLGSLESDWKVGGAEAAVTLRGARHNEEQFQAIPVPEDYLNGVELGTIFPVFEKHLVGPRLFIDAICNDYMPTPNFYDGFKVQQVMDAAIKSHDSRCWVDIG